MTQPRNLTPCTLADSFALARRLRTPVWVFDTDRKKIAYANEAACRIWRAGSEADLQARDMSEGMTSTVASRLRQYQQDFALSDASFSEFWTLYPQGEPTTVKVIYSGFEMPDGRMAMLCEVTGEADDEPETLRSSEALLHTDVMITLYSIAGAPLYANPAARSARPEGVAVFEELFGDEQVFEEMRAEWLATGECRRVAQVKSSKGYRWYDLSTKRCLDAATGNEALLVTAIDVSELKTARDTARFLADRDQLTGCYNRSFITQQLELVSNEVAGTDKSYAVLFLDIDKFKQVNDRFGHEIGDTILRTFAQRVRSMIRGADILARMGGDEFVVLIEDVRDAAALSARLEAISTEVRKPIECGGFHLTVTTSIGVSLINADTPQDGSEIIRQADIALYTSKRAGRNRHTVFNAALGAEVTERTWLETELKKAVDNDAFTLHYQPRVDIKTAKVVSAEALLRWKHPDRGYISPELFIPISEKIGVIDDLGTFVLDRTYRQLREWRGAGFDIDLSLNVSPVQFQNPEFIDLYRAIAGDDKVSTGRLELELTESSLFGDNPQVRDKIKQITDLGFRLALDDFGTGYSNLAYISRFPLSCIKLDMSFVQLLPSSGPLLRLILTLAREIGATTVAEGVETQAQLTWLAQQGCDQVQGFLFSKAVPEEDFTHTLATVEKRAALVLHELEATLAQVAP